MFHDFTDESRTTTIASTTSIYASTTTTPYIPNDLEESIGNKAPEFAPRNSYNYEKVFEITIFILIRNFRPTTIYSKPRFT